MRIRKGDKVLIRLTATESRSDISKWFSAEDSDGDEVTVCVEDVVAVEPAPLPEEPALFSLVESGLKVYRRMHVGWTLAGVEKSSHFTWKELNEAAAMAGRSIVRLTAIEEDKED